MLPIIELPATHFRTIHNGMATPRIDAPNIPIFVFRKMFVAFFFSRKIDKAPKPAAPVTATMTPHFCLHISEKIK